MQRDEGKGDLIDKFEMNMPYIHDKKMINGNPPWNTLRRYDSVKNSINVTSITYHVVR